jgi:transcriptional regulator with XRE-family HTH domain
MFISSDILLLPLFCIPRAVPSVTKPNLRPLMLSRQFQPSLYISLGPGNFKLAIPVYRLCYNQVMARISDHPVRLARVAAGLSQSRFAELAGVQRSALTALEDGRTKRASDRILGAAEQHLGVAVDVLVGEIELWLAKPSAPLKAAAENLLLVPPYVLGQYYQSFAQWRKDFAGSVTAFASLLRVSPSIVRDYESGKLSRLPDGLSGRLLNLGVSPEYLLALEGLSRG